MLRLPERNRTPSYVPACWAQATRFRIFLILILIFLAFLPLHVSLGARGGNNDEPE
jgi:hypothetical protein